MGVSVHSHGSRLYRLWQSAACRTLIARIIQADISLLTHLDMNLLETRMPGDGGQKDELLQ